MDKKYAMPGLVGIIIGLLLAWSFAPTLGARIRNPMMGGVFGGMYGSGRMEGMDAHFIEQMIPHHEDAIIMAQMALENAEHEEIKGLAEDIIRTQTEEIESMKKWYRDWFGKDVPNSFGSMSSGGMMRGGMMGDMTDLEELRDAQSFDQAFIEGMIPHHQMAVMMSQMLLRSTERQEMSQLASNIISSQSREIDQMRGWYRDWYGR